MEYSELGDQDLIQLIGQSQAGALEELYDRYSHLVFGLALNSVGDRGLAEEITQDVFTSIWQKASTYRADRGQVSTWLGSIARYRAIDMLRRKGARPEQSSVAWSELPRSTLPSVDGPEESIALSLQQQRVRAAVAQLPEEQKTALALAYFRGQTQSQIAQDLGLPLGTVKTRVRLAMNKLREMLREERETL